MIIFCRVHPLFSQHRDPNNTPVSSSIIISVEYRNRQGSGSWYAC